MAILKLVFLISIVSHSTAGVIDARIARDKLSASQDSCKNCTEILVLFVDVISDAETQDKVKNILEELCHLLPGTMTQNVCEDQVKQLLPLVIQFLTDFIKTNQICTVLGMCETQSQGIVEELLAKYIADLHLSPGPGTMTEMSSSLQCTLCLLLFKGLDNLIPITEGILVKVLSQACRILPAGLIQGCRGFVELYVQRVLEFLLSWITPQNVCCLLRLCTDQDHASSACYSCQTLAILARFHLGSNATELQTSAFLESVCLWQPSSIPKCDSFTQRYGPILQKAFTQPVSILEQCEEALLCAAEEDSDAVGGDPGDPCGEGTYRCRDIKTAEECKSVSFCQKHL